MLGAVLMFSTLLGGTLRAEATVTLGVLAGDPEASTRLIQAQPGGQITYVITAKVEDGNPEQTIGLGGGYVTLECNFGETSQEAVPAEAISAQLARLPFGGLVQRGRITDIGGAQDTRVMGRTEALGVDGPAIIAQGVLTVPTDVADGVYPIRVTPPDRLGDRPERAG